MQRAAALGNRLVETSYSFASGRMVGLATATFVVFLTVILPEEASRNAAYFGDAPTPDGSFIYSASDLYDMANAYGEDGRRYYIRSRFTFDVVWPLAYGWFLWAGIAYFGQAAERPQVRYTVLLPILAVLLDFMENTSASIVMALYPDRAPVLAHLVPVFTFAKWVVIGLSFTAFGALVLIWLGKRIPQTGE
ncbi:hypothetical protein QA600_14970 [Natronococcus sp. A-GB1]|uniref:hypothetical protein n=1 Tax=Natronococcus sp. A-GB1 TaxID=3037648 RepID=UPI00241C6376|nr:hypothetical protein [Natronococcus sp. A-GB1]MDG5760637.1 hypothetical protein [Natronococcus sp. A-GB1]